MSAKLAKYDRLYEQIKGYVQTTDDIWARLATMEAVLHHKMQTFFWTGVYALIDDELIVRSYHDHSITKVAQFLQRMDN